MHNQSVRRILFMFAMVGLVSCQQETTEAETPQQPVQEQPAAESAHAHEGDHSYAAGDLDQATAEVMLEKYLQIKDALVQSDANAANRLAISLAASMEQAGPQAGAVHMLAHLSQFIGAEDLEAQRVVFEQLSEHMYQITKIATLSAPVYKQYCPMAFDDKGAYWISAEDEVLNPYFGDMMLRCGQVQETIGG